MVKNSNLPGYKNIVYPGPIFPASFSELEELKEGGFYIYNDGKIERKSIMVKKPTGDVSSINHQDIKSPYTNLTINFRG